MSIIRLLDEKQTIRALPDLCEVLADCVEGGASVSFMSPFTADDARPFWEELARAVGRGEVLLLVAEVEGRIVGTVNIGFSQMPNQPHRGDVRKLLVHRSARGLGLSRLLMEAAEKAAADAGKTLLVLDTATGSPAEAIYERFGWSKVGTVPGFALYPDGSTCGTTFFYKALS